MNKNAYIVSVFNVKGGVGKTTISSNISHILAAAGYKVLHVDFDPQGSSSELIQPMGPNGQFLDINDILSRDLFGLVSMDANTVEYIFRTKYNGLDIIPNARSVDQICNNGSLCARFDSMRSNDKYTALYRNLGRIRNLYDYIIIDGQPSMDSIAMATIIASDYVLTPLSSDTFNIQTVEDTLNLIDICNKKYGRDTAFLGFFLNAVPDIRPVKNNPYIELRNHYATEAKEYFIDNPIRFSPSSGKAFIRRELWLDYALGHTITLPNQCIDLLKLMYKEIEIIDEEHKNILMENYGLKEKHFSEVED